MRETRKLLGFLGVLFLFPAALEAQVDSQKLDDYFLCKMKKADLIGLQVASIGQGEVIWQGSFGLKEINTRKEVYDTLYTLPEGGDSPLKLSPYVRAYFEKDGKFYHAEENFASEKPGSSMRYCNMAYATLGVVIEEVSGQSFPDFMQKEIFGPLGMHNSYWLLEHIPHNNIARPHKILPSPKKDPHEPEVLNHYGYPSYPDGQLRTTVSDYAQVLKLMVNGGELRGLPFLKKATVDEYFRVQYPEVDKYQAICWNYNEFESILYYMFMPRLPSHTGADPGIATVVSIDPGNKRAGIIFSNSPTLTFGGQKIFYQDMMKKLLLEGKNSPAH